MGQQPISIYVIDIIFYLFALLFRLSLLHNMIGLSLKKYLKGDNYGKKTSKRKTLNILDKNKKHSQFDYTEIFRHIRTNIEFSTVDKDIKSICITSSQAGEAKTTLSINLAYIFATKYNRVLLIDCDLRKNTLHKYMGLSNKHGLTDALLEYRQTKKLNVEYFQSVKDPSFAGTMAVLTSGIHIPNPSELLGSHVFKDYINERRGVSRSNRCSPPG